MTSRLSVFIAGFRAGILSQDESGALSFRYDERYLGVPLCTNMPVSGRVFGDKVVRPYLAGVLPDNPDARRQLGRELGVSGNNPFALLRHVGLDCPGAVQFFEGEALPDSLGSDGFLRLVTDVQIAARLAQGRRSSSACWASNREHWSLGGQQSKIALRKEGDRWYSCEGATATTHILKPGISDLQFEALNEYVCLKLAAACGIPAAHVAYELFEGEPAIVIERYDRTRLPDGSVFRLHQVDCCQALGVLPENKYPEDGGPSTSDMLGLLKSTGNFARYNVKNFISMLFFNYLIAAPDAHAKNYSLLLDVKDAYLAPLYDVASMLPYTDRPNDIRTAMGIAGENRVGRVSAARLGRFAESNAIEAYGLGKDSLVQLLLELAEVIPAKLEQVVKENSRVPGMEALSERLLPGITQLCKRSAARASS